MNGMIFDSSGLKSKVRVKVFLLIIRYSFFIIR